MHDLILEHLQRYPLMTSQDVIKLVYQSVLGNVHLINDQAHYQYLEKECQMVKTPQYRIEAIGHDYVRFHLFHATHLEIELLHRLCQLSSENTYSIEDLKKQLLEVKSWDLGIDHLSEDIDHYIKQGCPLMHHSPVFKQNYDPHYRVLKKDIASYYKILLDLKHFIDKHHEATIAIDGMCGSGKSTLATLISKLWDVQLFHMDDFFLQPYQRTPERFQKPGENVDHERFKAEVLLPLSNKESVHYRKFDCSKMALCKESTFIPYHALNIIEGTYSMHPDLREAYDLTITLSIDPDLQKERILKRNGPERLEMFIDRWIPLENHYFNELSIFDRSDLHYDIQSDD